MIVNGPRTLIINFDAASKAQKAVEHILGTTYQPAEYNPEDYEIDKFIFTVEAVCCIVLFIITFFLFILI